MDLQLCRLCLEMTDSLLNLFEEKQGTDYSSLVAFLETLFNIKYENIPHLPTRICYNCLYLAKSYSRFRNKLIECEENLLKHINDTAIEEMLKDIKDSQNESSLEEILHNDNCDIVEIDPNENFSSTEDEFSNESDAEVDIYIVSKMQVEKSTTKENSSLAVNENQGNCATELLPANSTVEPMMVKLISDIPVKNTFLCQYCDMAFVTSTECLKHESLHDTREPFVCTFCLWSCVNRPNLILHIRENHDSERPFVCTLCEKRFCRRSDLKKHTTVHTGIRPFTCTFCSKSFSRNTNLTKHMRIHSGERPHVCQMCPRSFTTLVELITHSKTHSVSKRFRCLRCPSTFTRKDKLLTHERSHSKKSYDLQMHIDNRENSAQFVMDTSYRSKHTNKTSPQEKDQFYVASKTSKLHQPGDKHIHPIVDLQAQIEQNSRQFKCDICSVSYTREVDFQRHQALHIDTLFNCKLCGMSFNRREKLLRHDNEAHTINLPCKAESSTFSNTEDLNLDKKAHDLSQLSANPGICLLNKTHIQRAPVTPIFHVAPEIHLGFYNENRPEDSLDK